MYLHQWLKAERGRARSLAATLGRSESRITALIRKSERVDEPGFDALPEASKINAGTAILIERATKKAVKRFEMRPDLFNRPR
jgi:hypothetical protein